MKDSNKKAEDKIPNEILPDLPFMELAPDVHDWYMFEHEIWEIGEEIRQLIFYSKKVLTDSQIARIINICLDEKAKRGRQSFVMLLGKKINYSTRMTLQESLNKDTTQGVVKMVKKIILPAVFFCIKRSFHIIKRAESFAPEDLFFRSFKVLFNGTAALFQLKKILSGKTL